MLIGICRYMEKTMHLGAGVADLAFFWLDHVIEEIFLCLWPIGQINGRELSIQIRCHSIADRIK